MNEIEHLILLGKVLIQFSCILSLFKCVFTDVNMYLKASFQTCGIRKNKLLSADICSSVFDISNSFVNTVMKFL